MNDQRAIPAFVSTIAACWVALAAVPGAVQAADAGEPALAKSAGDTDLAWGPCPDFLPAGCAIAVLHGNPAQPNADVFFKVPGQSDIALHTHSSAERMVLVGGTLLVAYEGQAPVRLAPGMYAYGPAGRPHSARCESNDPCILMIAFEGPVDAMPVPAGGR